MKRIRRKVLHKTGFRRAVALVVVIIIASIGVYALTRSGAQAPYVTGEAETGTLAGGATSQSDSTASQGQFVKFGATTSPPPSPSPAGWYHTQGSKIVDSQGNPVKLNGLNWFGFETSAHMPHGLWQRSMTSYLDQMRSYGYNLIRVPFTNDILRSGATISGNNDHENPDLVGLTPLEVLDLLIERAEARGMKIILDQHCQQTNICMLQNNLWYNEGLSEQQWIEDWKTLATRYRNNPTVIGMDLHNEPHGGNSQPSATWGTGSATDWRAAAQRAGNAILDINPNVLIIVEGIQDYNNDFYWWGGNLMGVRDHPVVLKVPNRLVYSPHDYGPGVSTQPWFQDPTFPANMPDVWDSHWGYIAKESIAPILIGEFGGRHVDTQSVEGIWQNALIDYIKQNDLYWTYWCWNPNSGDTGGILKDDWLTVHEDKQEMINRIIKPL